MNRVWQAWRRLDDFWQGILLIVVPLPVTIPLATYLGERGHSWVLAAVFVTAGLTWLIYRLMRSNRHAASSTP